MNRTLSPLKLTKSPLVFVLAQARFEPILSIGKILPDIQDALRQADFTGLQERQVEIEAAPLGSAPKAETFTQWELVHRSKRCSFIIDRVAISYQTTHYSTFDEFMDHLRLGIETLERYAKPRECQRLGLRYVDAVIPADGKKLSWYVNPQLLGVPLDRFGSRLGQGTQSLIETGAKRRLMVRYTEAAQGTAFPIELMPVSIEFKTPIQRKEQFAMIDCDHFETESDDFSSEVVLEKIASLHDLLDQVFRELVTENALKEWE